MKSSGLEVNTILLTKPLETGVCDMFNSDDWSSFENAVFFLLVWLVIGVTLIYGKLIDLVKLKKIELRKSGILEKDE